MGAAQGIYIKKVEPENIPSFVCSDGPKFIVRTINTAGEIVEFSSDPRYFCEDNYLAKPKEVREIIKKYRGSGMDLLRRADFLDGALEQLAESGPETEHGKQ